MQKKHIVCKENTFILFNKIKGAYITKHPNIRAIYDDTILNVILKDYAGRHDIK